MKIRSLLLLALFVVVSLPTEAKKKSKKRSKANLTLVEAYSQRIVPGIPGSQPQTVLHIIAVWEGANYPQTMFWRGDAGWWGCNMAIARKIVNRRYIRADYREYETTVIAPDKIKKGDTLQIDPVPGGKFPIPGEIPQEAKNTLFFKTGGSGWLSFPLDTIVKKHDIIKP